jgi:polyisoprenoid-binding protein YceI
VFRPSYPRSGLVALGAALLLLCSCSSAAEYAIDPDRTGVTFEMRSLGIVHRGKFNGAAGAVTLDADAGVGRIDIVIDARSVDAGGKRMDSFVRGPALLNVEKHPEIIYRARRVVFVGDGLARIDGELTLLGVTWAVPLAVTRFECANQASPQQRCSMIATASFRRSAFGMTRYRLIANDEVRLAIHAEGVRIDLSRQPAPCGRA